MTNLLRLCGDWAPCSKTVSDISLDNTLVVNIEAPVIPNFSYRYQKSLKAGPSLVNNQLPKTTQPGIAVLANNHMMDFGVEGLFSTIELLRKSGWLFVGSGLNKQQAESPIFFDWEGQRAALFARCETQFGIASSSKVGVAAFDADIYEQIRRLKKEVDIVIVSIHAAAEMVPWPSPRRQSTWRALIDAGADVVHGHHSHVPQGWESYKGGYIFYGLGNFCVDPQSWGWHPQGLWSLAPELEVSESGLKVRISTLVIDDLGESIRIREASSAEHLRHMAYLTECNRPLLDAALLEGLWQEASVRMYGDHYAKWLGFDSASFLKVCVHRIRAKLSYVKKRLIGKASFDQRSSKSQLLLWYHMFACDSHNDSISTALGVLGGELADCRNENTAQLVNKWMTSS